MIRWLCLWLIVCTSSFAIAGGGNETIQSFSKAKRLMLNEVYSTPDVRKTLYCAADFNERKVVTLPEGYETTKHLKRSKKLEFEHVTPAENFGRNFVEWREGHSDCVDSKGRSYKGRRCAQKTNSQYRFMQADLYNMYPSSGANNALRQNYNFTMLPGEESDFGACDMKVADRKVEPPKRSRGRIARAYLYMEHAYQPLYRMSDQQRKLMNAWDAQYPVTDWECERARRIERLQGNKNAIMVERCS